MSSSIHICSKKKNNNNNNALLRHYAFPQENCSLSYMRLDTGVKMAAVLQSHPIALNNVAAITMQPFNKLCV